MKQIVVFCLALWAAPALACPSGPDIGSALDRAHAELSVAPNHLEAHRLTGALWVLWLRAPDATAQALLDRGIELRESYAYAEAEAVLTELVEYCPDYAEGWNQRAFVRFLRTDYATAIPDLERALALRPRHLGALSGKAQTHLAMGQIADAVPLLQRVVRLNPWAQERQLAEQFGTEL